MKLLQHIMAKPSDKAIPTKYTNFENIRAFIFGDEYLVVAGTPNSNPNDIHRPTREVYAMPFHDLDEIIDVMVSEFQAQRDAGWNVVPHFRVGEVAKWIAGGTPQPSGAQAASLDTALIIGSSAAQRNAKVQQLAQQYGASGSEWQPTGLSLIVTAAEQSPIFEPPPIEAYAGLIRQHVVQFTLSGQWGHFNGMTNL